ncbi:type II toxin-antitoxin system RelE/ParE family toxin [Desulfonatronovibrio magnus]|uniref:type II toxin-antitoxin system RelE/ParE family toxin n=1 Tax=Desulfonatronovibrio magnus TaxID=698827 RepID=UPI0005EB2815|nr:type II toxin-antitoxin system RelE/ParE family toxin [Desulfonatronovibrio magnus]
MIKSFKDKNTEKLYSGTFVREFSGFQRQAIRRLQILDSASCLNDLKELPSNRFEALKGSRKGEYSISVNMQWRVTFKWYQDNPQEVGIEDYH